MAGVSLYQPARDALFPFAAGDPHLTLECLQRGGDLEVVSLQETRVRVWVRISQSPRESRHVARVSALVAEGSPSRIR